MKLFHSKTSASPRNTKRRGAAVVEFAIIFPLISMMLLGMIELSRGLMVKVMLSDAARKGCRTGIQRDRGNYDTVDASGVTRPGIISECINVMQDNGFNSSKFNPNSGIGSVNITVTYTDPQTGNTITLPDSLDAPSGSIVSVQVSIPLSSTTWVPSMFLAQGSMESETVVLMKQ